MLNVSKGNMYDFVDYTWNTIKGKCSHGCSYCYCKRWGKQRDLHFDEKELKTELVDPETGKDGLFIFVGSSCDIWADEIPENWILLTLKRCNEFPNIYFFQSKNPQRFSNLISRGKIPYLAEARYCTTLETNRDYPQMGNAPSARQRSAALMEMDVFNKYVTIEPIMDFDIEYFIPMIKRCCPLEIYIGADSGGHKLPEPPAGKVKELIAELSKFTEVKIKKNLNRVLREVKP